MEMVLLMEEILHHLGCKKPCKSWDKLPINWCRISGNGIFGRKDGWRFVNGVADCVNLQMVEIDIIQPEYDEHRCRDGRGPCIWDFL